MDQAACESARTGARVSRDAFWAEQARRLDWMTAPTSIRDVSFDKADFRIRWFGDGVPNVAYNCLDRHLETPGDETAIIWEGDEPTLSGGLTYRELHAEVCRMANVPDSGNWTGEWKHRRRLRAFLGLSADPWLAPRPASYFRSDMMIDLQNAKLAVLGLGYVGLPLAAAFGATHPVVGFDIDRGRIAELRDGHDRTLELDAEELAAAKQLTYSSDPKDIEDCTVFIVTVPTPIDAHKRPDLAALLKASATVAKVLKGGDIVIYESTVYPGATEEDCIPVLERISGLKFNVDFFAGYSPERANPGDREHRFTNIRKVTSGSTSEVALAIDRLYNEVVEAGTHPAPSIRVAEAAKVIENTQRDVNIALVNELAIIFNRLGIDTEAVLEAAGTKWNFLPFRPGLVGGHCIGVDPYYLTHRAQAAGYHPEMILSGRRINDGMGRYVVNQLVQAMICKGCIVHGARVLVLGLAFKENCPDLRNTRVVDIVEELKAFTMKVDVYDPWVNAEDARHEYDLAISEPTGVYDAIILAVAHMQFRQLGREGVQALLKPGGVVYDLKYILAADDVDLRL